MPGRNRRCSSGVAKWKSVGPSRPSPISPARPGPPARAYSSWNATSRSSGRPRPPCSTGHPTQVIEPVASSRSQAMRSSTKACSSPGPPRWRSWANSPRRCSAIQSRTSSRNSASVGTAAGAAAAGVLAVAGTVTRSKLTRTDDPSETRRRTAAAGSDVRSGRTAVCRPRGAAPASDPRRGARTLLGWRQGRRTDGWADSRRGRRGHWSQPSSERLRSAPWWRSWSWSSAATMRGRERSRAPRRRPRSTRPPRARRFPSQELPDEPDDVEVTRRTIVADGLDRSVLEIAPRPAPTGPLPAVVVLHGLGVERVGDLQRGGLAWGGRGGRLRRSVPPGRLGLLEHGSVLPPGEPARCGGPGVPRRSWSTSSRRGPMSTRSGST